MDLENSNPHDVKNELRKRHGSVAGFERARNLPEKSVNDLFRGRASRRVKEAVAIELQLSEYESEVSDSSVGSNAHRLIEAVR